MRKITILCATVLAGGLLCGAGAFAQANAAGDVPEKQYEEALSLLRREDYVAAEKAFRDFLAKHEKHALAGHAQYWLGVTFQARRDNQQAAVTFSEGMKKYPNSSKAMDMTWKLGETLALLDKRDDACRVLRLVTDPDEGIKVRDDLKRRAFKEVQKLRCR